MAEWLKAEVLKTVVPFVAEPWVRILLPPPAKYSELFEVQCVMHVVSYSISRGEMAESAEGARLLSECRV